MRKLLEENTVKRFMKLANIEPLTEGFTAKLHEEDDEEDDMPPMDDMGDDAGDEAAEEPMDDMGDMGDMDMDAEGGEAKVDMPEEQVLDLVDAIASAVEDVTGVAVDAVSADEGGDDMDMDMDIEMDDEPEGEEPMDMGAGDDAGGDDEVLDEMDYMRDKDKMEEALLRKLRRLREHKARKRALRLGGGNHRAQALREHKARRLAHRRPMRLTEARLNRVAERVMRRVRAEVKAGQKKDQLAERVMNRVVKRLNEASRAQKVRKTRKARK